MNKKVKAEARAELAKVVAEYRARPYDFWASRIDKGPITSSVVGASGTTYGVEIEAVWDDYGRRDTVRVFFAIDDGRWRWVSMSLTETLLVRKDGSVV